MSERNAFMAGFDSGCKYAQLFGNKQQAIDYLKNEWDGAEPIYFTIGLSYRNPTTHNVPLTLEEMIEKILHTNEWIDVRRSQRDGALYVDFLSGNDMW